jgi:ribosomal protein S18 acetylase RimI-like enzyme
VTVTIEVATPAHAEELTIAFKTLVPQLTTSNPPPGIDAVRELLASEAIDQFVARDAHGRIIGVSTLAVFPIPTARRAWIEDVIVDEAAAGQGVGAMLVAAMIARAGELGCVTVDLTSRPSREAANHLYRKLGFTVRETNIYRYEL